MVDETVTKGEQAMMQRVLIEFVVEIPSLDVAKDVETRIAREHQARLCDVLQSVTGYPPIRQPGKTGIYVATEPVTWNEAEQFWVGPDDGDDDDDEEDEEDNDDKK